MFLCEQQARSVYEYAPGFHSDPALVERHVWSPLSCRFVAWTYQPLVRCDNRGNTVKGSRVRNPFIQR